MLKHPLLHKTFIEHNENIVKEMQKETTLEQMVGFCTANIIKLNMLPVTESNTQKLKAYKQALSFYNTWYYYDTTATETNIINKIWFFKLTEKDAKKYLEEHKNKKSDYICNNELCELLEYLLAN